MASPYGDIKIDNTTNGSIYDLSGRRVNNPQRKGIYIQNGKKILVR